MTRLFTSRVEVLPWGRSNYTVIRVPEQLIADARQAGTRRVAGTINGVAVNVAVNRAPVIDEPFLWAGASLLRRLEAEPGEHVECALSPVDPDAVDLPQDLRLALTDADCLDAWEALSGAARRRQLYTVDSARKAQTRARRISELVAGLRTEGR